ncbi:MAG TPA: hypothetical protein VG755_10595 [Nannocystaceae bacterium]|nr:hypothetical protein [Nannocystaceae bacterium]
MIAVLVPCACTGAADTRETTTTSGPSTSVGTTSDTSSSDTTSQSESTSVASTSGVDGSSSSGDETGCTIDCPVIWPNDDSRANSDPWIAEHHAEIDELRPNVLAINYVNARSMDEMNAQLEDMIEILAESSRPHGYADADAPPMLRYQLAHSIDLRDAVPPDGWPYRNSTLYPREDPVDEYWGFDYEALFTPAYAEHLGLEDPDMPGVNLGLCDAIDRGLVHEIWIYGDADVPDVSAAEVLERKPRYDESRVRIPGEMDGCAGNGCFDQEDSIPCERTVRIAWFNNTRGPGCFLESLSHGLEGTGRKGGTIVPYLSRYFPEITGMDLDDRYGTPFESWYACPYGTPCLSYPAESSVTWTMDAGQSGTIDDYDPICGNVHWPPNATQHYDLAGASAVRTSCTHWRDGSGQTELYTADAIAPYLGLAPDCMGAFLVWWRQNLPGKNSAAIDDYGAPVLSFLPFQFY